MSVYNLDEIELHFEMLNKKNDDFVYDLRNWILSCKLSVKEKEILFSQIPYLQDGSFSKTYFPFITDMYLLHHFIQFFNKSFSLLKHHKS
jgi:hypothetical protein